MECSGISAIIFTPVFKQDVLWYGAVRLSVHPSTVYAITQISFSESFNSWAQNILGYICGRYWKLASQLIEYAHNDPIKCFHILSIPDVIVQYVAFEFGTIGTLNILIDLSPGHGDVIKWKPFSPLLALCAGNSPVTGEFHAQRPVTRSFDVFFDLRLNTQLSNQSWGWWFETPSRPLLRHWLKNYLFDRFHFWDILQL